MRKSKNRGVLDYLRIREMGFCASMPRNDYRLFTNMVLSDRRIFRKAEAYTSSNPMFFEADRIYMNQYRRAFSVVKQNLVYDLVQSTMFSNSKERITDADIFYLTSAADPGDISCPELFVGLTDTYRLLMLDARTGKQLKAFQLPPKDQGYKFSELGIGKDNETLTVKGRLMSRPPTRQPHFVFAIFNLAPLRFHCMFVLDEKVVGPYTNAMISQDLLIFVHNGSVLRFYSLEDVLYQASQTKTDVRQDGILQPNVSIDWPCPCLYEIRVAAETLEMGGFPWHCLFKPPKQFSYRLQAVATSKPVILEKNQLRQTDPGQGMEVNVFFNPDESGSVIFVEERAIKKLRLSTAGGNGPDRGDIRLDEVWSFAVTRSLTEEEDVLYTASGRKAHRSAWICNDELQYIHCVQYSSSMDAFYLVVYYETPVSDIEFGSGRKTSDWSGGAAKVLIVDNQNGRLKKQILLEEPWKDMCEEHHIELDDDVLIHMIKHRTGKHSCHVYRLAESFEKEPSDRSAKSKKRQIRASERRRSRKRPRSGGSDGDDEASVVNEPQSGTNRKRGYNSKR